MNKTLLASALFLGAARCSLAGIDQGAQQLLAAAEHQVDIFGTDVGPVLLAADFVAQVRVPEQGHLIYHWQSADRWIHKIDMGTFQQAEIKNGEKLYTSRNMAFTPIRVGQALNVVAVADRLSNLSAQKQEQRVENNIALTCIRIQKDGTGGKHETCINSASHEIVSDEWKTGPDGKYRVEYSNYAEFHGRRFPRKIELFEDGIKAISMHITSLTNAPVDEASLVPPKGAIERRLCPGLKHAVPIKTPDPSYPKSASENHLMGDTTVAMTVLTNGSVDNIQLIGSGGRSMDDATLQTLKSWKFKPAMCGAEPVVSDIEVVVSFRLN